MASIKFKDFKRYLERCNCEFVRQKGNHQIWQKNGRRASVTGDSGDVSPGLIRKTCKTLSLPLPT